MHPEGYDFAKRYYVINPQGSGNYRRHELLSLLVSLLPEQVQKNHVHFRKRLVRYEQDTSGATLYFADGNTASCDVLIGADGIKSPTRYCLYAEKAGLERDKAVKSRFLRYAVPRWSGMGEQPRSRHNWWSDL